MKEPSTTRGHFAFSGALAGAASALIFTVVHDLVISDIWFSLVILLIAGGLCGACLGWSYSLLVKAPSLRSWLGYNLLYDAMFVLLALVSVLVYEPMTPMAALMALNGPPDELITQAMPMTALFILIMALGICLIYGFERTRIGAVLLTSVVLVLLLGLNVSVIGLVSIPRGSWYLVMEMLALIIMLNIMFMLAFVVLERKSLLFFSSNEQRLAA